MRLFAQLSWYFRREWQRYLGAVCLLIIIAILQLIPPKVVGYVVDGVTEQHYTTARVLMWVGTLVLTAVIVYLLRYVWRVLLFGASYQLAVELREDFYHQLSRQHPEFYLRHRTGDLIARATNDVDRVVFAAGEGVLTLVDSLVMGCAVLIPACPVADAAHGVGDQPLRRTAARAFQAGAGGVFVAKRPHPGEHDQHPDDQSVWPGRQTIGAVRGRCRRHGGEEHARGAY